MRPIKFRGKRIKSERWVYGAYIPAIDEDCCDSIIDEQGTWHIVFSETVGQYTGLKDKKGAMIFEGDILLLSDGKSHSEDVVVEHGLYGWTFYNPQTATFYSDGSHTYVAVENCRFMFGTGVVIGNIHDNPRSAEIKRRVSASPSNY